MWNHDCGVLPVVGSNGAARVVGMITDRDICMCAYFQGKPLGELQVSTVMSKEALICRPSDTLADAERIMRDGRVRRVPVVDEKDALVGMISMADLAQEAARERATAMPAIAETEVADVLAAISRPISREVVAESASTRT
jgi:CBS-domain-containing membrane protein